GEKRAQALQPRGLGLDADKAHIGTDIAQDRLMLPVVGIVHEGAQMHLMAGRQMPQLVPGADLVPLVGGIGNAVREEQDPGHAPYPRFRAMSGPSWLATASGRRRQVLIISAYLGFSGLMSGTARPAFTLYS